MLRTQKEGDGEGARTYTLPNGCGAQSHPVRHSTIKSTCTEMKSRCNFCFPTEKADEEIRPWVYWLVGDEAGCDIACQRQT